MGLGVLCRGRVRNTTDYLRVYNCGGAVFIRVTLREHKVVYGDQIYDAEMLLAKVENNISSARSRVQSTVWQW